MTITKSISGLIFPLALAPLAGITCQASELKEEIRKPNIVLIVCDDMGYADAGFNGCKDIPTPALDAIAANGIQFTSGYVTCSQCAPSRAGFMSGMYQNRFGREANNYLDEFGMPPDVKMFGNYMQEAGYYTGMVGKWHLGAMEGSHPLERGFDSFFGFLGGGSVYFPPGNQQYIPRILDGKEEARVSQYLTHEFGDRAAKFINENAQKPFFLYLAFNAPHTPLHAPDDYLARFGHITDDVRQIYAAMVSAMDDNIAKVMKALADHGIEENTLVVFFSDNGGPTNVNRADNRPLRGVKGDLLEGGVRVPFIMQWKGKVRPGQVIDVPVISLDMIPTALAAAGHNYKQHSHFDGFNLVPLMTGEGVLASRVLTWRFPHPPQNHVWGIRHGDWKLVREAVRVDGIGRFTGEARTGLYDLSKDISESNDLSQKNAVKRKELQSVFDAWEKTLPKSK